MAVPATIHSRGGREITNVDGGLARDCSASLTHYDDRPLLRSVLPTLVLYAMFAWNASMDAKTRCDRDKTTRRHRDQQRELSGNSKVIT
jgi:hypothetical protein